MKRRSTDIYGRWTRVGVLFGARASRRTPDLERLLLDTAREAPGDPRLFTLGATWLAQGGGLVARHRLRHLAGANPDASPILALIIEEAVRLGAPRALRMVLDACAPAREPGPLFAVYRGGLAGIAAAEASPASRHWGVWAPPVVPKADAIRPLMWILSNNPDFRARSIRRGDLRCSILETLRHDCPRGRAASESELARQCSATRAALRAALGRLIIEGEVVRATPENSRDLPIALRGAA